MLVSYRRTGGPKPRSDELVEVDDSGDVRVQRVVSLDTVGAFAWWLEPAALATVAKAATAIGGLTVELQAPGRPPYEVEELSNASTTLSFHPAQKLPRQAGALRKRLRELYDAAIEHPVAALHLEVDGPSGLIRLRTIGTTECEVELQHAPEGWTLFGAKQGWLASGTVDFEAGAGRQTLAPGWERTAHLAGVTFESEQTLQVRIPLSMKFPDGRWRDCQLTAIAGKGWF